LHVWDDASMTIRALHLVFHAFKTPLVAVLITTGH
jgi:hypothetical protein